MKSLIRSGLLICSFLFSSIVTAKTLSDAKLVPQMKDGKITAFLVSNIREGSIWEDLGLKNDDQMVAVNSIKLDSQDKALKAFKELMAEGHGQIHVLRDGEKVVVDFVNDRNVVEKTKL